MVAANQEVWLIAKRVDDGSGVKRLYFRNGSAFNEGQSARLGSAGSGSGGGNPYLETLKNQLVDSPYELVTPNIITTDSDDKFATLTGATLDIVNNVIKFTANAQVAESINMLDEDEFLPQGLDVSSIDLSVFWNQGTTLQAFDVPAAFTYEASRDGGANYFPVTMSRVGTTNAFRGTLRWDTTTTTEATNATLATQTGSVLNRDLAASGADQALSQSFVVPAGQTWVLKQVVLNVTKTGTPNGTLAVALVQNNAGVPSTAATATLAQSSSFAASSLTTGANTITIPTTVLVAGTYHVVVTSDATYKATPSFASNKIQLQEANTLTGESSYNGTVWSTVASRGLIYSVKGRSHDLRIKITSAGSPTYPTGLDGWGVFYNLVDTGLAGSTRKTQRFGFNSTLDNLNSFAITAFNPDPDLLSCYWVEGGQVFKSPAFQLQGNTAVFPANSFNNGGISAGMTLIFDQNNGGAFDNSDSNARLLAANHFGSPNGADDRSSPGRGFFTRTPNGTLIEVAFNDDFEMEIYSV
jgi:hypothetical protein